MTVVGPINPWLAAFAVTTTIAAIAWALIERHQARRPQEPDLIEQIEAWMQETSR